MKVTVNEEKNITAVFEKVNFYLANNGVTVICPVAAPGQKGNLNEETYGMEYVTVDRPMLEQMISNDEDVTGVCTSHITDMSGLFQSNADFNGDISSWDVSSVTGMNDMFYMAKSFNGDLSNWNVSSVKDMRFMFDGATDFNVDLSSWCVSQIGSKPTNFDYVAGLRMTMIYNRRGVPVPIKYANEL